MPTISASEQYMLELINRARLDPLGEAARFGIDLNKDLAPGTITGTAKSVLAPNMNLQAAAEGHSQWMLNNDVFSHTGAGGSRSRDRMADAGYQFQSPSASGENIAWRGTTGSVAPYTYIKVQHQDLFLSSGHRTNILRESFEEIGVGQIIGQFTQGATTFNTSMVTQNYAASGNKVFITGVAYTDSDNDKFYSQGEGAGGVSVQSGGASTSTMGAGGYSLQAGFGTQVDVAFGSGGSAVMARVDTTGGNAKVDLVNGTKLLTSVDLKMGANAKSAVALGVSDIDLSGNELNNVLLGNKARNDLMGGSGSDNLNGLGGNDLLAGGSGNDTLSGGGGNDSIYGGTGNDSIKGGDGRDTINGQEGSDRIFAGGGDDRIWGLSDRDVIWGEAGNDLIYGGGGNDKVRGSDGQDTMFGGSGFDNINGGGGSDIVHGGGGNDVLAGGTGADTFLFGGKFGKDWVRDFDVSGGDRVLLKNMPWISDFGDLISNHATDTKYGVKIVSGPNQLVLQDVSIADLSVDDFVFDYIA